MIEHSVFSVMSGLIVDFSWCPPFMTLCNGLKMSEYEAHWLTGLIVRRVP